VYQAGYNDEKVAIKIFHSEPNASNKDDLEALKRSSDKILEKMEKQVELMASLNHPNIVRLLGFCRIPPAIMTELCSEGHLAKRIKTF
jgi:serine/threonine protein kinase